MCRSVATERTLILIKPDAVRRKLAGEILGRIEARGFEVAGGKLVTVSRDLAERHYAEHEEKPFFGELVEFITSGPTWALVVEGEGAIATMRTTIGATNPANAEPGTIRGDLAMSMPDNLVHGSDSPESAEREVALWFAADELA
jgi:nucleoside-diphosphate kinase